MSATDPDSSPAALPDYGFGPWLESRSSDWFDDDALLRALLDRHAPEFDRERVARFGPLVAGRLRVLAEESARPEQAPSLRGKDPHDHVVDEVVLPASTHEALQVAHGDAGLGAVRGDAFTHYTMIYLLAQNGEAGVACSLACTDGLVRSLQALPGGEGGEVGDRALAAVLSSGPDGYAHGAQFVTEIQGGSDVPANRVRAVPDRAGGDGGSVRLHGQKWFCSNINADWFMVTARPEAARETGETGKAGTARDVAPVGLFLVPAYVGGRRNGYRIERLKDKLGTRELATAEVTFDGARAWPVGPEDRGLSNLLRYVLTPSRYACVVFAAGALRRAERLATSYAEFREAFGRPIGRYPLVRRTLEELASARERALVASFELLRLWEAAESGGYRGQEAADFRVLLSLAKPVLTRLATEQLHEAMMVLAGNGIEERFSPLPRLFRDAVIMETWEGPHNVLYTQAVRDFHKLGLEPEPFVERVAGTPRPDVAKRLEEEVLAVEDPGEAAVGMAELAPAIVAAAGQLHD